MSEKELDDLDLWVIKRHLELRKAGFYGKVILTYVKGDPSHREVQASEKPPIVKQSALSQLNTPLEQPRQKTTTE